MYPEKDILSQNLKRNSTQELAGNGNEDNGVVTTEWCQQNQIVIRLIEIKDAMNCSYDSSNGR